MATNTLHVFDSIATRGLCTALLPKGTKGITCEYKFQVGELPREITAAEWQRCRPLQYTKAFEELTEEFFATDFNAYESVTLWFFNSSNSMLMLAFLASAYKGKIYLADLTKEHMNPFCLTEEDRKFVKERISVLPETDKTELATMYNALPSQSDGVRVFKDGKFEVIPTGVYSEAILKRLTTRPQNLVTVTAKAYCDLVDDGIGVDTAYLHTLGLEMVKAGEFPMAKVTWEKGNPSIYFTGLATPIKFEGKELRKAYNITVAK